MNTDINQSLFKWLSSCGRVKKKEREITKEPKILRKGETVKSKDTQTLNCSVTHAIGR